MFTSPSTFQNFSEIQNVVDPVKYFRNMQLRQLVLQQKSAIENKKVHVNIIPDEYTIDGLVKSIVEY